MSERPEPGARVTNAKGNGGRLLRYETYPGTGNKKWATVKWDWAMFPRRVDPADITKAER